ncbi:MAG: hypothetical protein K2W95_27625 [Candidatus Obscuribacterales bacterium]|nr:hypothetical protein [Candidatus Obscuribacterales bacterium]
MNNEKNSLTLAPSNLLDSPNDTWAEEFARSAVWGGLQSPLLGVTQIIDKAFDTKLQQKVEFMTPSPEAQPFSGRWHAQQLGTIAGMAVPLLLLHKGVGICGNRLLGKLESDAATSLLSNRVVQESIATGMLFDGLLRPLSRDQQNDFIASRAKNALIGGITFGTMTGASIGIKSLMQAERGLGAALIRSEIGSTMLSGVPAGLINAELTSRLYEGKGPSRVKLTETVYCFAVLGGTMAAGKQFVSTTAEAGLSQQLRLRSQAAQAAGAPGIADRVGLALTDIVTKVEAPGRTWTPLALAEATLSPVRMEAVRPFQHSIERLPVIEREPGTKRPEVEQPAEEITINGGGTVRLLSDGKAILKDFEGTGETTRGYRSMGADRSGSEYFLLYDLKATPAETAASISMFVKNGKATPVDIESSQGYYAEPWTEWTPGQISALNEAIPAGSTPIGVGTFRQAWLTPKEQIVVIGPTQPRPDCPYLRKPFKTEQIGLSRQIETFEYADSRGITPADVAAFDALMLADGWTVKDSKPMNYARSNDGKMWRIDPDEVHRLRKAPN